MRQMAAGLGLFKSAHPSDSLSIFVYIFLTVSCLGSMLVFLCFFVQPLTRFMETSHKSTDQLQGRCEGHRVFGSCRARTAVLIFPDFEIKSPELQTSYYGFCVYLPKNCQFPSICSADTAPPTTTTTTTIHWSVHLKFGCLLFVICLRLGMAAVSSS